jgi:hypothetical protein
MTLFPFTDLFPWIGKQFQAQASEFLRRYVEIAAPMLIISKGDFTCNITATNFLHSNGPKGKVTSFVGLPKLASWAGEEWLDNDDSLDPPEDTLAILCPISTLANLSTLVTAERSTSWTIFVGRCLCLPLAADEFLDSRGGLAPTAQLRKKKKALLHHVRAARLAWSKLVLFGS